MSIPESEFLSTGQIAAHCAVSPVTVARWISSGKLRGHRLTDGGHRRVRRSDFVSFLKDRGMGVPEELLRRPRILIVEDEYVTAAEMSQLFEEHGYETRIASTGIEAGALLVEFKPSVITLDLCIPGLDGHGVLAFLRDHDMVNDVKVVVVSAMDDDEISRATSAGVAHVLRKPFEEARLLQLVDELFGLVRGAGSVAEKARKTHV